MQIVGWILFNDEYAYRLLIYGNCCYWWEMNDGLKLLLLLLVIPASFMYLYMLLKYSIDIFKTDVIGGIVGIVLIVLMYICLMV